MVLFNVSNAAQHAGAFEDIESRSPCQMEVKQQSLIFESSVIETSLRHGPSLVDWLAASEKERET